MSIERFLAVNLAADLALLAAAARALGLHSPRRVCLAALAAAALGAGAYVLPGPWRAPPAQLALLLALARGIAGPGRAALLPGLMLCLAGGAAFLGGWAALAGRGLLPLAGGLMLLSALTSLRKRRRWEEEIRLEAGGRSARFVALIDTGNRLREPLSGLPVMIVEAGLVRDLIPTGPCRRVAYGALGGGGTLPCFRPDGAWRLGGKRSLRLPDLWVAVSPLPLPGPYRALMPGEFAALPLLPQMKKEEYPWPRKPYGSPYSASSCRSAADLCATSAAATCFPRP